MRDVATAPAEPLARTRVHGLLAVHDRDGTAFAGRATMIRDRATGDVTGAVFGLLDLAAATAVARALSGGDDPGRTAQDLPWAACVRRPGGRLAAACSTMFASGLFHRVESSADGPRLVIGTEPLPVAPAGPRRPQLDEEYLRGWLLGGCPPRRTPFVGVARTPPGETFTFDAGTGRTDTFAWCAPATMPPATRRGERVLLEYLDTFDTVVRGLVDAPARTGPVVATVSGGLDSTFLAASLVRATRSVRGLCHRPLAESWTGPVGNFDPDDFPWARQLADRYPGRLGVEAVLTDVHPLDASRRVYQATGWPDHGPGSSAWTTEVARRVREDGANVQFSGFNGNATFSSTHPYALGYHAARGEMGAVLRLLADDPGRLVRPLRRLPRMPRPRTEPTAIGLAVPGSLAAFPEPTGRERFLLWAGGRLAGWGAGLNPGRTGGVHVVDPFAARSVIELAASIEPAEWCLGPDQRSLARRLGAGRVPDSIRLRTRRGGQGMDAWYLARRQPDRLRDSVAAMLSDDLVGGLFDRRVAGQWLTAALATPATAASPTGWEWVLRAVALHQYVEWLRAACF